MSVADKMSQAYVQGADDQKRQQSQELEALRELADDQARIIASMQKQLEKYSKIAGDYYEEIKRWQDLEES